ncbi:MAG: sulfotransferase family protein [Solimonas sp.]
MTPENPPSFVASEARLHEAAAARCGMSDFGDAGEYLPALRKLLHALDHDTHLTPEGRHKFFDRIVQVLVGRAYSQAGWRRHPQSLSYELRPPIVITGLPRTGTTALHRVLAADPQFQGLEYWLIDNPMPRPPRAGWDSDPLYRRAVDELETLYREVPAMKTAHPIIADEVYECLLLTRQNFLSVDFTTNAHLPSYQSWFLEQDFAPMWRRYRDNLRLIGLDEPDKPWLLKNPASLFSLSGFLDVFPQATIIQTHRNPVTSVASGASLARMARISYEGPQTSLTAAARREVELWGRGIEMAMDVRRRHPDRYVDVYFSDFASQPMDTIRMIYERCGLTLSERVAADMQRWLVENPQGKHGEHKYSLDGTGISEDDIRRRFAPYIDLYGLAA